VKTFLFVEKIVSYYYTQTSACILRLTETFY